MNAVEREPVETRILNPTASEASYKPKQRSYRKTNPKKIVLAPDSPGAEMSGAESAAPKRTRPHIKFFQNLISRCLQKYRSYIYFSILTSLLI